MKVSALFICIGTLMIIGSFTIIGAAPLAEHVNREIDVDSRANFKTYVGGRTMRKEKRDDIDAESPTHDNQEDSDENAQDATSEQEETSPVVDNDSASAAQEDKERAAGAAITITLHLAGNSHLGEWGNEDTEWTRNVYVKRLRCTGGGEDSCEECSGTTDCWYGDGDSKSDASQKLTASDSKWKRHIMYADLKAEGTVKIHRMTTMSSGVEAYWNGNKLTDIAETSKTFTASGTTRFALLYKGSGSVTVKPVKLEVPKDSLKCMEDRNPFKPCLHKLWTRDGLALRNDNTLLKKCLAGNLNTNVCTEWKNCLNTKAKSQIETTINAVLASGSSLVNVNTSTSDGRADSLSTCVMPSRMEPLAECCTCWGPWTSNCASNCKGLTKAECLRATACARSDICSSWKQSMCDSDKTCTKKENLLEFETASSSESHAAKLQQARAQEGADEMALDGSLSAKACV